MLYPQPESESYMSAHAGLLQIWKAAGRLRQRPVANGRLARFQRDVGDQESAEAKMHAPENEKDHQTASCEKCRKGKLRPKPAMKARTKEVASAERKE